MSTGRYINFRIGGGGHGAEVKLFMDGSKYREFACRSCDEEMWFRYYTLWDEVAGRRAHLLLQDHVSERIKGPGHLNFDTFNGDIVKCGGMFFVSKQSTKSIDSTGIVQFYNKTVLIDFNRRWRWRGPALISTIESFLDIYGKATKCSGFSPNLLENKVMEKNFC